MKKALLIVVVLVVMLVGWMLLKNNGDVVVNTLESPSPVMLKNVIIYTDSGYIPKTLKIKKGETVTWKNQSSGGMWTASGPHPIHTEYPQKGGCINSIFDECKADPIGTEWSFTFTYVGTWGYHNHIRASHLGTVVVE